MTVSGVTKGLGITGGVIGIVTLVGAVILLASSQAFHFLPPGVETYLRAGVVAGTGLSGIFLGMALLSALCSKKETLKLEGFDDLQKIRNRPNKKLSKKPT